jgi:hypothetical protein
MPQAQQTERNIPPVAFLAFAKDIAFQGALKSQRQMFASYLPGMGPLEGTAGGGL